MRDPENYVGNRQIVWIGGDNTLDFILKEDGVAVALDNITKIELDFDTDSSGNIISDTTANAYPIKWAFDSSEQEDGKISIQIGSESDLPATPEQYYKAQVWLYDSVNTNGICWGELPLYLK